MGNTVSYNRGIMGLRSYANGSPDPDDELYRQLMRRLFGGEAPPTIHSYGPDIDDTIWRLITESGAAPAPHWLDLPDNPEDFFKAEGNRLHHLRRKPDPTDPLRLFGKDGTPIPLDFDPWQTRPEHMLVPRHRRDHPLNMKWTDPNYPTHRFRDQFPSIMDKSIGHRTEQLWDDPNFPSDRFTDQWESVIDLPPAERLPPGNYLPPGYIDLDSDVLDRPDRFPGGRTQGIEDLIREAGGRPPHLLDQQPFRVYPPLPDEHWDNVAEMMGGTMTPEGEVKIPLGQTGDVVGIRTIDPQAAAQRYETRLAAREAAEKAAKKAAARKAAIRGVAIAGASTLALPAELAAEFALFPEEMGGREASQPRNTYMSQQEMDWEDLDLQPYVDIYGSDPSYLEDPQGGADLDAVLNELRAGTPLERPMSRRDWERRRTSEAFNRQLRGG